MKKIIMILSIAMIALPASALEMDFALESLDLFNQNNVEQNAAKKPPAQHKKKMCAELNFSGDQKKSYKEVRTIFMNDTQKLRNRLKVTAKRYVKVLRNPKVDGARADKIARRLTKMGTRLRAARTDLFHTIVYDIATTDQRMPLLKCMRQMRRYMMVQKMKKMHKKNGKSPHGGKKPGNGGHH